MSAKKRILRNGPASYALTAARLLVADRRAHRKCNVVVVVRRRPAGRKAPTIHAIDAAAESVVGTADEHAARTSDARSIGNCALEHRTDGVPLGIREGNG